MRYRVLSSLILLTISACGLEEQVPRDPEAASNGTNGAPSASPGAAADTDSTDAGTPGAVPNRTEEPRSDGGAADSHAADSGGGPGQPPLPGDDDGDGVTADAGDCNDGDPMIFPGASVVCGDAIDQDCAGGDEPCAVLRLPRAVTAPEAKLARGRVLLAEPLAFDVHVTYRTEEVKPPGLIANVSGELVLKAGETEAVVELIAEDNDFFQQKALASAAIIFESRHVLLSQISNEPDARDLEPTKRVSVSFIEDDPRPTASLAMPASVEEGQPATGRIVFDQAKSVVPMTGKACGDPAWGEPVIINGSEKTCVNFSVDPARGPREFTFTFMYPEVPRRGDGNPQWRLHNDDRGVKLEVTKTNISVRNVSSVPYLEDGRLPVWKPSGSVAQYSQSVHLHSPTASGTPSFKFRTIDGTAKAGTDYVATTKTVTLQRRDDGQEAKHGPYFPLQLDVRVLKQSPKGNRLTFFIEYFDPENVRLGEADFTATTRRVEVTLPDF